MKGRKWVKGRKEVGYGKEVSQVGEGVRWSLKRGPFSADRSIVQIDR